MRDDLPARRRETHRVVVLRVFLNWFSARPRLDFHQRHGDVHAKLFRQRREVLVDSPGTVSANPSGSFSANTPAIGQPGTRQFVLRSCERYPVIAASGRTMIFAPFLAASRTSSVSFVRLAATSPKSLEHCTAATFTVGGRSVAPAHDT
jgi:hypothetical protein